MDLLDQIKKYLDPSQYKMPTMVWNSLIINSRIRFHSFFRHALNLSSEETLALREYRLSTKHFKQYLAMIRKYWLLKRYFLAKKTLLVKKLSSEEVILLKNFSYRSAIEDKYFKDPFFHSFTERLSREKNHLVIVDPLMTLKDTKLLLNVEGLNIIPWFTFLKTSDFIKALFIQLTQYFSFTKKGALNSWDKELKQELLHPTTFAHLLFYFAFQRITRTFSIKRFILTFENNSWEKVVMQAFRENSPATTIVGYQHSVVPESTLGMRFLPWEIETKNIPDLIYTTGLETQNILRSFNLGLPVKIEALCALRYEYLYSMKQKNGDLAKRILVAVDAIIEASDLINIVLEQKDYFIANNFKITFRFHPAMTYDFFKNIIDFKKLESFASVSKALLYEDIDNHDCVIYWGSTVSLESSFVGNPLIHFHSNFPLSHDPLYLCNHLKMIVTNSSELQLAIEKHYQMDLESINLERAAVREYIRNYFYKPTATHLDILLGHSL